MLYNYVYDHAGRTLDPTIQPLHQSPFATAGSRDTGAKRPLSKLEEQGLIQVFEFTHELAWNTLKDFLEERGVQNLYGSRDATREAFKTGLIENGEAWMDMVQSRNLISHTYEEATAAAIVSAIRNTYFKEFEALRIKLEELKKEAGE